MVVPATDGWDATRRTARSRAMPASAVTKRVSTSAHARSGTTLLAVPPPITPTFTVLPSFNPFRAVSSANAARQLDDQSATEAATTRRPCSRRSTRRRPPAAWCTSRRHLPLPRDPIRLADGVRARGEGYGSWLKGQLVFASGDRVESLKIGDAGRSAVTNPPGASGTTFTRLPPPRRRLDGGRRQLRRLPRRQPRQRERRGLRGLRRSSAPATCRRRASTPSRATSATRSPIHEFTRPRGHRPRRGHHLPRLPPRAPPTGATRARCG